jgi:beta-lactamase class A
MQTGHENRWRFFLFCLIGFLLPNTLLSATGTYDVSYLWTTDLTAAKAYARKVKKVLGPDAAKKITLVRSRSDRYGVIYDRDGSYQTAVRVAQHHARLLHQSGVTPQSGHHAASPLRDRGYWRLEPSGRRKSVPQTPPRRVDKQGTKRTEQETRSSSIDSRLEAEIDRYIKHLRQRGRLKTTDKTSLVVYDISKGKKIVSINEDQPRMAASLIKNFVMLAYFHEVFHRRQTHTDINRAHLRRMIQRSSNPSTNYFIRLLGGPRNITRILRNNYPYFEQTHIVEYIPAGGRTYRNVTSAHDLNRFYNQLWLSNLPYASKMKYYLGLPNGDRIYNDTCIPIDVRVYNKTGTVYGLVGDSGILVINDPLGNRRAYVFTGLIEDTTKTRVSHRKEPFSSWVNRRADILRRVSEGVYEYIYEAHYGGTYRCRQHGGRHLKFPS